ncbi:MAG: energy-coupling factor ABC transporter ATP-binding protein [Clostridiales bacterium]|nr:energy-coupling factor ABC transporter ATP-binding protein [Clostridiales bacterium]
MGAIEIKNLTFSYPLSPGYALSNVNFSVADGEFCILCGKSGSGKSTLLRLLKKEIAPAGNLTGNISEKENKIGFVDQNVESNIVTDTVFGELAFSLQNTDMSRDEIYLRIAEAASYFNLNGYINERVENLSGGTKQILALACVMEENPGVLLLDEPCSQLDPVSSENFINMVLKLNREQGITVIMSEHRAADLFEYSDKILFLNGGKTEFCGKADDFADYLVNSNSNMKNILPSYSLILKNHPVGFSKAKKSISELKAKEIQTKSESKISLCAKRLAFTYKKNMPDVLYDLNYTAYYGCINIIIGANGSGKTTLLKCLSKILKPYSGKVRCNGKIAYMPQNVQAMFLEDKVMLEVQNKSLLEKFGLSSLENCNPFDLSGGEAQKLALAKITDCGADVILLDEPTKSIDAAFKSDFAEMLRDMCRKGKTIVAVTHDLEFAGRYADYAAFLFNGEIIAQSGAKEFFSSLKIYTTALSRLTQGKIISVDDAEEIYE